MSEDKEISFIDALNEEIFVHYPIPFVVFLEILRRKFGGLSEEKNS